VNHPRKSHTSILGFSPLIRAILPLIIIVVASVSAVLGAEAQPTKRVLMLFSESKFVLGNVLVEQAARDVLRQAARSIEFYAEYHDAGRFPEESHYRLFREYLQEKYARRPPGHGVSRSQVRTGRTAAGGAVPELSRNF
jgi:hypothetical protein